MMLDNIFSKNKIILFVAFLGGLLLFMEQSLYDSDIFKIFIPKIKVYITMKNGDIVTSVRNHNAILVPQEARDFAKQLELSGDVKSIFSLICEKLTDEGDIIVDVGAYLGYNEIILASKIGDKGKIYAYEPDVNTFGYLRKNIIFNNLEKYVTIKNLAIFDKQGIAEFSLKKSNSIVTNQAKTTNLDTEFYNSNIDLLMIDIDGSEFLVLNGAEQLIQSSPKIKIVINLDVIDEQKYVNLSEEILNLENSGFKLHTTYDGSVIKRVTRDEMIKNKRGVLILSREDLTQITR